MKNFLKIALLLTFAALPTLSNAQATKKTKKKTVPKVEEISEPPKVLEVVLVDPTEMSAEEIKNMPPIVSLAPKLIRYRLINGKEMSANNTTEFSIADFKTVKTFSYNNQYNKNNNEKELQKFFDKLVNESPNLEEIEINYASLKLFPEIKIIGSKLKIINISNNQLEKLPIGIEKLKNLEEVILDNNKITSLPDELGSLKKLSVISLNNNPFINFPEILFDIPGLKTITFNETNFNVLPNQFDRLPNLETLVLQSSKISDLPPSFSSLKKLKSIYLSNNSFTEFPKVLLDSKSLQQIDLSGNPFTADAFIKSLSGMKWRGLLFLNNIKFSPKEQHTIKNLLKKIDVYFEE